jgi:hypothetical protein
MKLFNIDLHISVIADMKKIFTELGHEVDDLSLSDHTWVFNRKKDSVPMLDGGKWMGLSTEQFSNNFYNEYKEKLKDYDAFIVTYPPPFSLLYDKFEKPIIVNIPIRYEWPFSFRGQEWKKFNDYLRDGVDSGKITLVANNLFDKFYTEQFIDREVQHIPSICDYNNEYYKPNNNHLVYYSRTKIPNIDHNKIKWKNDVLQNHQYSDLTKLGGIVHFPYAMSLMSIFEQYTSNIPLFFPTEQFMLTLYQAKFGGIMGESSFNLIHNQPNKSSIPPLHGLDLNDYKDIKAVKKWIELADFYDEEWMPHINYFNSFKELNEMVKEINTNEISKNMEIFNTERKVKIYNIWSNLLKKLL